MQPQGSQDGFRRKENLKYLTNITNVYYNLPFCITKCSVYPPFHMGENFKSPYSPSKLWTLHGSFYIVSRNSLHISWWGFLFILRIIKSKEHKLSASCKTNMKWWNRNKITSINAPIQKRKVWKTHSWQWSIVPYPGLGACFLVRLQFISGEGSLV